MSKLNESQEKFIMLILAAVILIAAVMILSPISVVPDPVKVSYPYERNINCIEFSSDSKLIAVGYSESYLRVWDIENGEDIYDPEGVMDHERLMRDFGSHAFVPVSSIDFSNDGHMISSGHTQVHIWNNNGTKLRRQSTGTPRSNAVVFSSDGEQYAYPSENDGRNDTISINIVHTDSGDLLSSLKSSDYAVEALVFTPDGKYLLARYDDGKIIHWDWKNSTVSNTIDTSDRLRNFDFSDDASTCAGLSRTGAITIWNTSTGDVIDRIYTYQGYGLRGNTLPTSTTNLVLSSDGKYLAGSVNFRLSIWDLSSGKIILDASLGDEILNIKDIAFSPDTKYLAASTRLYDKEKYYFDSEDFWTALNASVDRDLLLYSIGGENVVYLWDFEKLKDGKYVQKIWQL